jgi:hypothetical protein
MRGFRTIDSPLAARFRRYSGPYYLNPLHSHACVNLAGNPNGITSLQKNRGGRGALLNSQSETSARGGRRPQTPPPRSGKAVRETI